MLDYYIKKFECGHARAFINCRSRKKGGLQLAFIKMVTLLANQTAHQSIN